VSRLGESGRRSEVRLLTMAKKRLDGLRLCKLDRRGFDSLADHWGWYVPRTVAYREGRKHATVMWSNTPKEQKCLSKIVVRADDEFE